MPIIDFSQQPTKAIAASTAATTITFDNTINGLYAVTMSSNTTYTFTAGSNIQAGDIFTVKFIQDATGSRVATWPSNFKKAGGTLTLTTTAAAVDMVTMFYDGTNFQEVARSLANA